MISLYVMHFHARYTTVHQKNRKLNEIREGFHLTHIDTLTRIQYSPKRNPKKEKVQKNRNRTSHQNAHMCLKFQYVFCIPDYLKNTASKYTQRKAQCALS